MAPEASPTTQEERRDTNLGGENEALEANVDLRVTAMGLQETETLQRWPQDHAEPSYEPPRRRPFRRRRWHSLHMPANTRVVFLILCVLLVPLAEAAFINFENCLAPNIINSKRLQFVPRFFDAKFNTTAPSHDLNVTIYGNVTGQTIVGDYPPPDDPIWSNPNETFGKIVDVSPTNPDPRFTTLFADFKVLTYTPYRADPSRFCESTINTSCPIGPVFYGNGSDPYSLPAFTVAHEFYSSYAFATFQATIRVQSGDQDASDIACVSANITPDLGKALSDTLAYLPAAVLALVAIATISAAIFSPWGSSDPFRWTSNYGRDEDLLRLVTPGFGDCLQYIQFIVLAGSLSLSYPGYYQPVISQAAWSVLLFNESYVSQGNGSQSLIDGIYFINGTRGISRLGQLAGMSADEDVWACMAIWLMVIIVAVSVLCQVGFFLRWGYRYLLDTPEEDLRSKNWPFTAGMAVRIVFNYFLLPIIAISLFQLVVAPHSNAAVVGMAVVLLLLVAGFATWIFRLIFTTRPRAHLFDDLPTVLLYGPLYNTYSDVAAPFAFIPVLLTVIRGVAIGAIQPSGVAQLVILAICEVIFILTLHAFRPFQAPTSMNAYHTFFSVIRLVTTLLSIAFVPALGISQSSKGWLGYAILLCHAIVLTLIEVCARAAGAGGDARGGLARVFGKRQLSRRTHHHRSSLQSDAAILASDSDSKSAQLMGARSRSLSASSAILLNNHRVSSGFDQLSQGGDYSTLGGVSPGPGTPGGIQNPYSYLASGNATAGPSQRRSTVGTSNTKNLETNDPYYRPPRTKRQTMDPYSPESQQDRGSWNSGDLANRPQETYQDQPDVRDPGEIPAFSPNRGSITPAYLREHHRGDSDPNLTERRGNTDYTVRESDFYYGVTRGPALSSVPARRLKTGPADPMGPVSSASGWIKGLFGGKRKDKGKGFEVVRSQRAPQLMAEEDETSPPVQHEPYKDSPDPENNAAGRGSDDAGTRESTRSTSVHSSDYSLTDDDGNPFEARAIIHRVAEAPPTLAPIETTGGIELSSRPGSQASTRIPTKPSATRRAPTIPRKSSRRTHSQEKAALAEAHRMPRVPGSPAHSPERQPKGQLQTNRLHPDGSGGGSIRLPFASSEPSPGSEKTTPTNHSAASSLYPNTEGSAEDTSRGGAAHFERPRVPGQTERPPSTGYVHQHVAGESVRPGMYRLGDHMGSSAEIVGVSGSQGWSRGGDRGGNGGRIALLAER
ncbi:hypothetical protein H2199_008012 [Coniosporium tulheliwenetii]|uniref:Uncharacterized protein n=1 Tax=Coniosporium tulheliwenetii TaxID=3383036 RepID=A0ACC2YMG2_9PEZI|nr:hypothetical protein H2199_008012 [Cladosporium sp. JES 115]